MSDFEKEMDFEIGFADSLTHEEIDEMFAKYHPSKTDEVKKSTNAISIQSKNDPTRQTSQDSSDLTSTQKSENLTLLDG